MIPEEFFTLQSMLTLTGATGATFVVSNGLQKAFNFNPKWLALAIALVISLFGVYASHGEGAPHLVSDYFVGVINGFLIYCTAAGATHIAGDGGGGAPAQARGAADAPYPQARDRQRKFLSPWF